MQRALHVLRAYGNVLEAVYSAMNAAHGEQRRVPSLAECAAREVGRAIEENVRACLAEGYSLSDDESSDGKERLGDDSVEAESETSFLNSVEMERSASAQELDLEGAKLQDEWYESCPAYASRYVSPTSQHYREILTRLSTADAAGSSRNTQPRLSRLRSVLPTHPSACSSAALTCVGSTERKQKCVEEA